MTDTMHKIMGTP